LFPKEVALMIDNSADFEVWIDAATPKANGNAKAYPVRVFSPAGAPTGTLTLDLTAADFQAELAQVSGVATDTKLREAFGERLFKALFTGAVLDAWNESLGRVKSRQVGALRLRLAITPSELAALPWEMIYAGKFIAASANMAVARYLDVPEPSLLLSSDKLKVLVVIESPNGLPAIDEQERQALDAELKAMGAAVEHKILRNATLDEIHRELGQDYHVIHFLGHGDSDSVFLVSDDRQGVRPIDADEFSGLFSGRSSIRLAILNACHSATAEGGSIFGGVGPAIVKKGLPAVISMQYPSVQLDTAGRFSRAFYGAIAQGKPVDLAVNEARNLLYAHGAGDRDWSTPVLHLGTRSGRILNPIEQESQRVEEAWRQVRIAAQCTGSLTALAVLTRRFHFFADQHRMLNDLWALADHLRALQNDFTDCVRLVDQWHDSSTSIIDVKPLKQRWNAIKQDTLETLNAFLEGRRELAAEWPQSLVRQRKGIDAALAKQDLNQLAKRVPALSELIAKAEVGTRQQVSQTIAELAQLSEQTLGRLNL
jgi:hypothetical protein